VSLCSEFRVAHFFSFFVLSCYVSLCSEFRVAHFFSFFLRCLVMFIKKHNRTTQKNKRNEQHGTQNIKKHNKTTQKKTKEMSNLVFLRCPVMCLYVLSSVLLISLGFFCVVLLCVFMF
jgi:hypothetical protein